MRKKGSVFPGKRDGKSEPLTMPYLMAFMTIPNAPGLEFYYEVHPFILLHFFFLTSKWGRRMAQRTRGFAKRGCLVKGHSLCRPEAPTTQWKFAELDCS